MGLDFPDIKFVVNYAAPRSIESFTQQSGRAGRQIEQAFSLVIYQSANVGKGSTTPDMRNFKIQALPPYEIYVFRMSKT